VIVGDAADPDKVETISCDDPGSKAIASVTQLSVAVNDRFILPRTRDYGSSREWHWKILRMRNGRSMTANDILSHEKELLSDRHMRLEKIPKRTGRVHAI
jgi:hypothetical protein